MNQQPDSHNLTAGISPVPLPITAAPLQHQNNPKTPLTTAERSLLMASTGTAAAGVGSVGAAVIKHKEYEHKIDAAMKEGLRAVHKNCREKDESQYSNMSATFDMNTHNVPYKDMVDCLKATKRLDKKTQYVIQNDEAILLPATFTTNSFDGSPPFASMNMNTPSFHKKQELFYTVGEPKPVRINSSKPDFTIACIFFGFSGLFISLFLFSFVSRQKRLNSENNLKAKRDQNFSRLDFEKNLKREQNLSEIGWEERKEVSNIALVLKESEFLNILYKYKMQTVNLTEAKDLLSTKFGLTEPDILLILNTV